MESNFVHNPAECHREDFNRAIRKNFKHRMNLEMANSMRERKAVAADMEISATTLCDWLKEGKQDSMPAYWLASWTREVGPGLLRWIAKENGLTLVFDEGTAPALVTNSASLMALIARHHGQVMGLMIQAHEDDAIDEAEREAVYPEIQRLIRELEVQSENFRPKRWMESA